MSAARKYAFSETVYFSIPIRLLVVGRDRPFPLFIYFKLNDHLILRYPELEPETEEQLKKLTRGGCVEFWSPKAFYPAYLRYLDPNISTAELNRKVLELESQAEERSPEPIPEAQDAVKALTATGLTEEERRLKARGAASEMLATLFSKQDSSLEVLQPEFKKVAEFTHQVLNGALTDKPRVVDDLERLTRAELGHSARVASIGTLLALLSEVTDPESLADLAFASLVHDIGKAQIDPRVLSIPDTQREELDRVAYQLHVKSSLDVLSDLGISTTDRVREIVLQHHERWTGGGFPRAIAGQTIRIEARVLALSDTIDECMSGEWDGESKTLRQAMATVTELQTQDERFDPTLIARLMRELEQAEAAQTRPAALEAESMG